MKSIKEKAEEFANKSPLMSKKGFEEGANYVLECIEESIKNAPAGYGLVYHIIEQLKR